MSEGHDRPAPNNGKLPRRERKALKKKRLEADHCIVIEQKSIRTAIG